MFVAGLSFGVWFLAVWIISFQLHSSFRLSRRWRSPGDLDHANPTLFLSLAPPLISLCKWVMVCSKAWSKVSQYVLQLFTCSFVGRTCEAGIWCIRRRIRIVCGCTDVVAIAMPIHAHVHVHRLSLISVHGSWVCIIGRASSTASDCAPGRLKWCETRSGRPSWDIHGVSIGKLQLLDRGVEDFALV